MPDADDLVRILSAHPNTPASGAELAESLGVSTRTLRNYVHHLNSGDETVVISSKEGYLLCEGALKTYLAGRQNQSLTAPTAPGERVPFIISELTTSEGPVCVFDLADQLCVSDSTIESDLTRVRLVATDFGLTLERDGSEVRFEGSERQRRRMMRHILTDAARRSGQFIDLDELARFTQTQDLDGFKEELVSALEAFGLSVNAGSADELIAHVAIMVDRVRAGHSISGFEWSPLVAARRIIASVHALIKKHFDVEISPDEEKYLELLIIEKTAPTDSAIITPELADVYIQSDYVSLIFEIVEEISNVFLVNLSSPRFVSFLSLHVKNLVDRSHRHDDVFVPSGLSVKNSHPLVYEIAVFLAQRIGQRTEVTVSEQEISLLAFHVGSRLQEMYVHDQRLSVALFMPRYYDLDTAVRELVNEQITDYGTVDVILTSPGNLHAAAHADLVICAGPSTVNVAAPVVRVSMLPTREDLEMVRDIARQIWKTKNRTRIGSELTSLIDPALFTSGASALSRREAIETLCRRFIDAGACSSDFRNQVWEREQLSSTSFPNGFAIPHAIAMSANRSAIGILHAATPIDWDGQPVRLVVMFAVSAPDRDMFSELFEYLVRMLRDRHNVDELLRHVGTFDDFMSCLHDLV